MGNSLGVNSEIRIWSQYSRLMLDFHKEGHLQKYNYYRTININHQSMQGDTTKQGDTASIIDYHNVDRNLLC